LAEAKFPIVLIEVRYLCDTGDGGVLTHDEAPTKDTQGEDVFLHRCSHPKDEAVYFLKAKYPHIDQQIVNLDNIKI
jgi:hypothetical protein